MNLLLSIISNILVYGLVVLLEKYFKKEGLFVWISIAIVIANILVCKNGSGVEFSEEIAKEILLEPEIKIIINLNDGEGASQAFGCDLTYDYVKINGDYRS